MSEEIEEWRPVVGFEGLYEVSDLGRVKSLSRVIACGYGKKRRIRERILLQLAGNHGYEMVGLTTQGGGRVTKTVHRIVASAFLGESSLQVNHINGNKLCNAAQNLEYVTQSDNIRHAIAMGLMKIPPPQCGEKNAAAKIREHEAIKVLEMRCCGMLLREISEMTGYGWNTVQLLCAGSTWKNISRDFKWQPIALALLGNS